LHVEEVPVEELCKELYQEKIAITLMTTENWAIGCKAYLYKNPMDYILKYHA
jgi:hypothetical protein